MLRADEARRRRVYNAAYKRNERKHGYGEKERKREVRNTERQRAEGFVAENKVEIGTAAAAATAAVYVNNRGGRLPKENRITRSVMGK